MQKIKKIIEYIDKKIDLKKFIKFGITGVLNTAIDFGVYTLCYKVFGLDAALAQPIGQAVAIVNSYLVNKNWTFQKRKNYNRAEILKFLAVNGASVAINIIGVYLLHDIIGLNAYLSKIPIAVVTIIINYFGNKLIVFK